MYSTSTSNPNPSRRCRPKISRAARASNSLNPHCVSWNGNPVVTRITRLKKRPMASRKNGWRTPMSERSTAREPIATCACSRSAALHSLSSSSMGAERSASVNSAHSPLACSMPWRTVYPLPRLPGFASTRAPAARAASAVPSREPSSTTTISANSHAERPRYSTTFRIVPGSRCASL